MIEVVEVAAADHMQWQAATIEAVVVVAADHVQWEVVMVTVAHHLIPLPHLTQSQNHSSKPVSPYSCCYSSKP